MGVDLNRNYDDHWDEVGDPQNQAKLSTLFFFPREGVQEAHAVRCITALSRPLNQRHRPHRLTLRWFLAK